MNFTNDPVQTQDPHFIDMGLLSINTLDKISVLGTPATRFLRPTGVFNWSAPDHVFVEATAVGMNASKSYHEYNYKTNFEIWRENQELDRQNVQ